MTIIEKVFVFGWFAACLGWVYFRSFQEYNWKSRASTAALKRRPIKHQISNTVQSVAAHKRALGLTFLDIV
jgi:hypothetical protein